MRCRNCNEITAPRLVSREYRSQSVDSTKRRRCVMDSMENWHTTNLPYHSYNRKESDNWDQQIVDSLSVF